MDKKAAVCKREHFRLICDTTPVLLCLNGARDVFVVVNEGSNIVYLGHSGTVATQGMALPGTTGFTDTYTQEEWWAYVPSGSGTLSGFRAIE